MASPAFLLLNLLVLLLCVVHADEIPSAEDLAAVEDFNFPSHLTRVRERSFNLDSVDRQRRVRPCGFFCAFRLCNYNGTTEIRPKAAFTILNAPRQANLPYICRNGVNIGQVKGSLEARVNFRGNFVPISRWRPRGLNTPYPANFIRTAKVPFLPWSGVTRAATSGNQWDFLHDRCMIMPVRRYEEIDPDTEVVRRVVRAPISRRNCVAFRTTAPAIQVELVWDSGDDFDVSLEEPDGDEISFNNPQTEAGKLNGDNNVGFCDTSLLYGKENILYFPGGPIESGEYKIKVVHYTKCGTKPTVWRLRVIINGVIKLTRRGVASKGDQAVVANARFTYP